MFVNDPQRQNVKEQGEEKKNDLCIIDVALDKEGTVFSAWFTRGRAGYACAVMSSQIPGKQQLNLSYFCVKQENCTCFSAIYLILKL